MITVRHSYEGTTKSSKHRTVPVPAGLVTILKAYRLADPWKGVLCFPNDAGEMYSRHAKLEAVLQAALSSVGLPRIRVHALRHVFASQFIMGGGDIFTLQQILPWALDAAAHVRHLRSPASATAISRNATLTRR